jgi:biopolymer transport protein ExbD
MVKKACLKPFDAEPVDLTPVIDVVFLLIIFFMLVCQFMAAEQFAVAVPEDIQTGKPTNERYVPVTVTVMRDEQKSVCAVGSQRLANVKGQDLSMLITSAVNEGLAGSDEKTVRLRCDKEVPFGEVKYILSGISNSQAEQLDWAVVNE